MMIFGVGVGVGVGTAAIGIIPVILGKAPTHALSTTTNELMESYIDGLKKFSSKADSREITKYLLDLHMCLDLSVFTAGKWICLDL